MLAVYFSCITCLREHGYLEAGEVNEKKTGKEVGGEIGLGVLRVKVGESFKSKRRIGQRDSRSFRNWIKKKNYLNTSMRGTWRHRFDPWVGNIPWRRKWQPTPVFLPGKSHGQRSLASYSPWGHKESDMTEATEYEHAFY